MSSHWSETDANGKPLTDGRKCYVIENDADPTMPPVYIYGKDVEEVLAKAAKTIETGQGTIHRMRTTKPAPPAPARPAATVTAADVQTATADLNNPAKAAKAVKTLLKSEGVDLDQQAMDAAIGNIKRIAKAWELANPTFPRDKRDPGQRNERILMDRVLKLAGRDPKKVTVEHFDAAFTELLSERMFFDVTPEPATVQPDGNRDSRTVTATSFRGTSLSSREPAPVRRESDTEKEWRRIATNGTSRELRQAIEKVPGFKEWMDKSFAQTA